jgi:hypothetical protein
MAEVEKIAQCVGGGSHVATSSERQPLAHERRMLTVHDAPE